MRAVCVAPQKGRGFSDFGTHTPPPGKSTYHIAMEKLPSADPFDRWSDSGFVICEWRVVRKREVSTIDNTPPARVLGCQYVLWKWLSRVRTQTQEPCQKCVQSDNPAKGGCADYSPPPEANDDVWTNDPMSRGDNWRHGHSHDLSNVALYNSRCFHKA